jgi:hypothetical protein
MSFMTETREYRPSPSILRSMAAAFGRVETAFRASAEFERLNALTDAQLRARGLRRDDLAETVFAKHYRDL